MHKSGLHYSYSPLDFTDEQLVPAFLQLQLDEFQTWSVAQFKQGANVDDLIFLRSQFIDHLLDRIWRYFQLSGQISLPQARNRLALIAVGGYGRAELHPLSDIDILFLSSRPLSRETESKIEDFIRLLWDIKLNVGHSVRTLNQSMEEGANDITTMTNLIESRLICGSRLLFSALHQGVFAKHIWPSARFYQAKVNEQQARHKQYHSTSYNLEPDLKNSPGGLRDLQTIKWISIRQFWNKPFQDISELNYLLPEEFKELINCQRFLWRMRFALHSILPRYDNRLLFDRQLTIASWLGYHGEGNAPVEKMMHDYYRVSHNVTELNQMLLQLFEESILADSINKRGYEIDAHFQLKGELIDLKDNALFMQQPTMIMQLFFVILQHNQITGIYPNTIRQLRRARRQQSTLLSDDAAARRLFMQIIKHPDAIKKAIFPMHRYGVLSSYLCGWKAISGMMQFNLFHAYTVDEHTIRLLLELDNLNTEAGKLAHPTSSKIYASLSKPELLIIAGLFHDIAKGQQGDHSELGAKLAEQFCQQHELDERDSKLVVWLVRHHLLMSMTAQSRDIQDPAVIRQFAQQVKSKRYLQYLLCLTVSDVCATNETLWNSWKQSLMRELYFMTERCFDLGIHQIPKQRSVALEHKRSALTLLTKQGYSEFTVKAFWKNYRFDYFLRHTAEQLVWHAQNLLSHDLSKTNVLVNPIPFHGGTEIFVYTSDRPYLFATVCNELSNANLTIHHSIIYTNKQGFALDSFVVLDPNGRMVSVDRHHDFQQRLEKALVLATYQKPTIRPLKPRLRSFSVPTQVNFLSTISDGKTYVEVITLDRPYLLACVAEVFTNLGLSLSHAKIATIGERAEDLFILTDKNNQALDDNTCYELKEALIVAIDSMA